MPPGHSTEGLEAARVIKRDFPETAVVVLSAHVEVEHAMDLLANGQRTGYLLKSRVTDVAEFIDTLRRVERGGSAVDPVLVQELVAARRADDPLGELTDREREVLALMAEGRSNAGIGQALHVTAGHGREARARHHDQAAAARQRRSASPGAGGAGIPRRALTRVKSALATP